MLRRHGDVRGGRAHIDLVEAAREELARSGRLVRGDEFMTWQPISSAPKDGTFYLATNGKTFLVLNEPKGCARGRWTKTKGNRGAWNGMGGGYEEMSMTHWRPLPAAPSKKENPL
jgi:hypothetical protein